MELETLRAAPSRLTAAYAGWLLNTSVSRRSLARASAFTLTAAFGAQAGAKDYSFAIVGTDLQSGEGRAIWVSLKDLRRNLPVSDAVIFATRLDMAPEGMASMKVRVALMPGKDAGIYRMKADLEMSGNWRLQVAAKVQGETETVQAELTLEVQP